MTRSGVPRSPVIVWAAFGAAVAAVVAIAVVSTVGVPVSWNDGCGADGSAYCAMVRGEVVKDPYSNRILIPWVIRAAVGSQNVTTSFLVVNLVALVLLALATGILAGRVAEALGAAPQRRRSASWCAGMLAIVAPMALRFTAFYPALVDHPATAMVLWWVVLVLDHRPAVRVAGAVVPALAVLTKESSVITVVLVGAAVALASRRLRVPVVAAIVPCVPALLVVLARPRLLNPLVEDLPAFVFHNLGSFFTVRAWAMNLTWATLLSFGLWVAVVAAATRPLVAASRDESAAPLIVALISMVSASFVVVALAGPDVARYLYPAVPAILALALGAVAADTRLDAALVAATAAAIVLARPLEVMDGTRFEYARSFSPFYLDERALEDRLVADAGTIVAFGIAALLWTVATRRRRAATLAPPAT